MWSFWVFGKNKKVDQHFGANSKKTLFLLDFENNFLCFFAF